MGVWGGGVGGGRRRREGGAWRSGGTGYGVASTSRATVPAGPVSRYRPHSFTPAHAFPRPPSRALLAANQGHFYVGELPSAPQLGRGCVPNTATRARLPFPVCVRPVCVRPSLTYRNKIVGRILSQSSCLSLPHPPSPIPLPPVSFAFPSSPSLSSLLLALPFLSSPRLSSPSSSS